MASLLLRRKWKEGRKWGRKGEREGVKEGGRKEKRVGWERGRKRRKLSFFTRKWIKSSFKDWFLHSKGASPKFLQFNVHLKGQHCFCSWEVRHEINIKHSHYAVAKQNPLYYLKCFLREFKEAISGSSAITTLIFSYQSCSWKIWNKSLKAHCLTLASRC